MSLAVTTRPEPTVLTLTDDVLNEETLRAAFRALDDPGVRVLGLDLRAVRLPTAAGLGRLVALNQELRGRGGRLILLNLAPDPYEVFEVTGLVGVLDVRRAVKRPEGERGNPI